MYKIFYFISGVFAFCFAGTICGSIDVGLTFLVASGIFFGLGYYFKSILNKKEN